MTKLASWQLWFQYNFVVNTAEGVALSFTPPNILRKLLSHVGQPLYFGQLKERYMMVSDIHTETKIYPDANFLSLTPGCRDQFRYVLSQWEMSLQCNNIPHWLGA